MSTEPQTVDKQIVLQAFEEGLRGIGYPTAQIQKDYGYSNFFAAKNQRQTVDLAAFGAAVPSLRTCNIGVEIEEQKENAITAERLVRLRALGAPLLFAYDTQKTQLSRWKMTSHDLPVQLELVRGIVPDRLPQYFADHKADWEPEAFQQARTATFREQAPQLDFFDVGLLPALEGELQKKLSTQIQQTAARSREILNEREGDDAFRNQFASYARLLFRLLAARLLSDRGDLPTLVQDTNVDTLLQKVEAAYHRGERNDPVLGNKTVQNQVWEALQQGLDLRNLSPETLAFVYENTLVDRDLRRRNGIHSTPPQVADYLLSQLPIERLPEADRVVFEPFCGNAPFLLAAMRRLRGLLPPDQTSDEVHDYLMKRLLGIEILPFACEIARYSLILGDYPNGNNWNIQEGNAFADSHFDTYLERANIVLCNPPHEDFAINERADEAHHNRAAEALRRVLQKPPKLLGFLMPLTFVDGVQYKSLRQQLLDTYPSITITALPDNVFGKAGQQTALIAANRLEAQKKYYWAGVSKQDYKTNFLITGKPTYSEEQTELPLDKEGMPILWRSQSGLDDIWAFLADYPTLDTVAKLYRGLQWVKSEGQLSSVTNAVSGKEQEGFAPGIQKIDNAVEGYVAAKVSYLDIRPEKALGKAFRRSWDKPKVLLNAARTGSGVWRLCAVSDTEGLYASHGFTGVWPFSTESLPMSAEALSGVLNGPTANIFMYQRSRGRNNDKSVLLQIPIPPFTEAQTSEITSLVAAYVNLRWGNIDVPGKWTGQLAQQGRRALLKIDAAVLDAYALPPELEDLLLRQFDGVERGHLPFAFNGYNPEEWAGAKAELADDREAKRIADAFFALLKKKNLSSLTHEEEQEYDALQALRTERRMQYRALIASGK